jgi:hypothetical protein
MDVGKGQLMYSDGDGLIAFMAAFLVAETFWQDVVI